VFPPRCLPILPGYFQSHAVEVEVKDASNATCLYAKWMMKFLIIYESNSSEYKNITLELPSNVTHHGSTCGNGTHGPLLAIEFGVGHSWSVNFTNTSGSYQGSIVSFTYNTNDTALFHDAKRKGSITVTARDTMHPVKLNKAYRCVHVDSIQASNVTEFFWNVTLQAFVQNGTVSKEEVPCDKDLPTTVPTHPSTSAPPTTPAHKTDEVPATGSYTLGNSTTCLLANMGLQLNISKEKVPWIVNINPNTTTVTGSCGNKSAILKLNDSNNAFIDFIFAVKNTSSNSEKFYLKGVNITLSNPGNSSAPLHAGNDNLSYWDTSLGSSYMCQKEQVLVVVDHVEINTFHLRIQPFRVKENKYSTAEECVDSDLNFLIPIVVGTALGFLIILVFISYLIGRRKSRTGYQSV
uniref:Lysosome-associated membrane glycoprotein 2 n=1 Tax=Sphenodon punctatus TaxID=8508 RepID=A0A8D0HA65_SPHPU